MALALIAAPAAVADEPAPVPQAPVLPVIPKTEVLPFTLAGGGQIQVAVLTAGQTVADAAWQDRAQLALAEYAGQDIRVLARRAGATDPADWFDATYKVRDSYPPGSGLGTEDNPVVALAGNDPRLRGWATGWEDYQPGTDVADNWKVPTNAVGPVGGSGYDGNMSVVVLGNGGRITMKFDAPVFDGPGPDFAVFENGFRVSGQENDFLELGYVEVSSNGTDFVRFDSGNLHDQPVAAFGGFPASKIDGVAGRDLNGLGTPFDLGSLRNKPAVRSGKVDLDAIDRVRIVDIVGTVIEGAPTDLDSFGRTIFDPYKTVGSGGFDLRGVGTINREGATIVQPKAVGIDTTTAVVSASVTGSTDGAQSVRLEWSEDEADHGDAVVKGTSTTPADGSAAAIRYEVDGLEAGKEYWYRFVSESADESEISTDWIKFTKEAAVVSTYGATIVNKVGGKAQVRFNATVQPRTDGEQELRIEYAESSDLDDLTVAGTETAAGDVGSKAYNVIVDGLELTTDYSYRAVSRSSDGQELATEWKTFRTDIASKQDSLANPFTANGTARLGVKVYPGTGGDLTVYLEHARNSAFTQDLQATAAKPVSGAADAETVEFDVPGLAAGTHYFRAVLVAGDASEKRGSSRTVSAPGTPTALTAATVAAGDRGAEIKSRVTLNTFGPQAVHAELSADPDHGDAVSTAAREVTANGDQAFSLEDLEPGETYWARVVSESTLHAHSAATEWVEFTTEVRPTALGVPAAGPVSTGTATVTVPVEAGSFDSSIVVEYTPNEDRSDPVRTEAQVVPAGGSEELSFALEGLDSNRTYHFRAISTADGQEEPASEWATFRTAKVPATLGQPRIVAWAKRGVTIEATVDAGDLDQSVSVEYRGDAAGSPTVATETVAVEAGGDRTVELELTGLEYAASYRYRVLSVASDDDEVATEWRGFTTTDAVRPTVELGVDRDSVRAGEAVTLTWSSTEAEALRAAGEWSGDRAPSGSESVRLDRPGRFEFRLEAEGDGGRAQESVTVRVAPAAADLSVSIGVDAVRAGSKLEVRAGGLEPGEEYALALGGAAAGSGRADGSGAVRARVEVPAALTDGVRDLVVTGSAADRTGTAQVLVLRDRALGGKLARKRVKRRQAQRITVTGLFPGESVRVRFGGKRVSPDKARANARGRFSLRFRVGPRAGRKKVTAVGRFPGRKVTRAFRIVR